MDSRQCSALTAFQCTQYVLDQNDKLLGNLNSSEPRLEFDRLVVRLEATAVAQDALRDYSKGLTSQKNALRESLFVDHIQPIVSLMEMNRSEMLDISSLEVPSRHDPDHKVALAARSAASMASLHRDRFVAGGLPPNFVEELNAAVDQFSELCQKCHYVRVERVGHAAAVEHHIARGWVVYKAIKALGRKALRRHPEVLAQFRQARLHRPRKALPAPRLALGSGAPVGGTAPAETNALQSATTVQPASGAGGLLERVKGFLKPTA